MKVIKLTTGDFRAAIQSRIETVDVKKKQETSEKFNDEVKQFLMELNCYSAPMKTKTYQLIRSTQTELRMPKTSEQLRIRMQQQINMIAIIVKMLEQHGSIDELVIATYTLNKDALKILVPAIESGKIKSLQLLLASSYSFRDKDYYRHLKEKIKSLNAAGFDAHLTFAWSHFKITLAACGENRYQLEGSMNYSTNNMAENLLFENNPETYKLDRDFILNIMHDSENKALEIVI